MSTDTSVPKTPETYNPYSKPPYDLVQSDPLDYWHSLLLYYDGVSFYWQIYNHQNGQCIQAIDGIYLLRKSAHRAGMTFWRRHDDLLHITDAGRVALALEEQN